MDPKGFFTFREYMKKDDDLLTASMEDYLEMIYRLSKEIGYTRTNDLAAALNVQPPSATRMMKKLAEIGFVNYEKYGIITLTESGKKMGNALMDRHEIIENFLQLLGVTEGLLEQTEKIEHTISSQTLKYLGDFLEFLKERPDIVKEFKIFQQENLK